MKIKYKVSVDFDNHQAKCRLCFRRTITAKQSAIIDKEIQDKFWSYTNFDVILKIQYQVYFIKIMICNFSWYCRITTQIPCVGNIGKIERGHKVQTTVDHQPEKTLFAS